MTHHRNVAFFWSTALRVHRWLLWALFISVMADAVSRPAHAQIIPDPTLGPDASVVVPDTIQGLNSSRIEGGAIRANVLFHSFDQFNVSPGTGAYFANPDRISTILSRVTGRDPSEIMGRLGVLGDANLFLLNPNGIMFGPDSSLDIRGSFMATTADEFTFANGTVFSAVTANAPPLLSLNVPIGLQYGAGASGSVINAGTLDVDPGNTLNLIGSSVVHTGSVTAPGGEVAIAAITQPSHLQFAPNGQLRSITPTLPSSPSAHPAASVYDWVTTNPTPPVGLSLHPSGQLITDAGTVIPTERVTTSGHVLITGDVNVSHGHVGQMGGHVQVLGDRVSLIDQAQIDGSGRQGGGVVEVGGGYQGNGIGLNAVQTIVGPEVLITADGVQQGAGGTVVIWSDDRTQFYGHILAQGGTNGGNGGVVEVSGKQHLTFAGHTDLRATQGQPGRLLLDPVDIIVVDEAGANDGAINNGQILATDGTDDSPFTITEETLETLSDTAQITLEATNNVVIQDLADDVLDLAGDGPIRIVADADGNGRGDFTMRDRNDAIFSNGRDILIEGVVLSPGRLNSEGGDITLRASDRIQLLNNSELNSGQFEGIDPDSEFNNFSQDFAGDITLTAGNDIQLSNAFINADGGGTIEDGGAGDIHLSTQSGSIFIDQGSRISSTVLSQGFAGDISLIAGDEILIQNSQEIVSSPESGLGGVGGGGIIRLEATNDITITETNIRADSIRTSEEESRGTISVISLQGSLLLDNVQVSTQAQASGFAGDILLRARQGAITLSNNSAIMSNFEDGDSFGNGVGGAGFIGLQATDDITISNTEITAESLGVSENAGQGNIRIATRQGSVQLQQNTRVSTTTEFSGFAGNIILRAPQGAFTISESKINSNFEREDFDINDPSDRDGGAGTIIVTSGDSLRIINNSVISANSFSVEDQNTTLDDASGRIKLRSRDEDIIIQNSRVATSTFGTGSAGELEVKAPQGVILLSGNEESGDDNTEGLFTESASGTAGEIILVAEELVLEAGARISARTENGAAGDIRINDDTSPVERVRLDGDRSRITARASELAGIPGEINIHAEEVGITNGAEITAASLGDNSSDEVGNIELEDVVRLNVLSGGRISVRTASGSAGDVRINLNSQPLETLILQGDESRITARATDSGGDSGRVDINGRNIRVSDRAEITAANRSSDTPNIDSSITLNNVETLEVLRGGQLSVSTRRGTAGNIDINSLPIAQFPALILVDGQNSTITAQATGMANTPTAGTITINTRALRVSNGGGITVSSPNGVAGNLEFEVPFIVLDNGRLEATIGSSTSSDTGANITVTGLDTLLVRNNSLISASAEGGAQGGNLTFGSRERPAILIGAPSDNNSDLIAVAQQGQGGTITLRVAQREGFTLQDTTSVRNNRTNDISVSAFSGESGVVAIDSAAINPLGDIIDLPEGLVETPPLDNFCSSQDQDRSAFVQVGRGGVPRQPTDVIGPQVSPMPWVRRESIDSSHNNGALQAPHSQINSQPISIPHDLSNPSQFHTPLIEAQSWTTDRDGTITLTASAVNAPTLQPPDQPSLGSCPP